MADQKKFLDAEGVKYLWSKINMQDYPDNETLMDVIEAIDETKADKKDLYHNILIENYIIPAGERAEIVGCFPSFQIGSKYCVIFDNVIYDNLIGEYWEDEYHGIGAIWGDYSNYPFGFVNQCSDLIGNKISCYIEDASVEHTISIYSITDNFLYRKENFVLNQKMIDTGTSWTIAFNIQALEDWVDWGDNRFIYCCLNDGPLQPIIYDNEQEAWLYNYNGNIISLDMRPFYPSSLSIVDNYEDFIEAPIITLGYIQCISDLLIPDTIARVNELPSKISQLENDSQFVSQTEVQALYDKLNSNTLLGFYCVEDVTVVVNDVSTVYPANSNVEIKLANDDVFEIIPTSDNSIYALTAFPGALGTFYPWLEGIMQFSNILFDMNDVNMYSKWSQGNQGAYHVQFAQYANCIFWSDNPYVSEVSKRTNYTLYYTSQLPLCYSTIPENTFKSFYLAFNVNTDPNWGNKVYRDSFAAATWATQVFSYYGARTIGVFGHDDPDFNIVLPKDCRGLMFQSTAIENAGTFDAINTTNFGAKSGSWREAFGECSSLRNLYIKNLKVNLNISWSPVNYESIAFIIANAANENAITISVSPYTYNLLDTSDFELATNKNITIALISTNYVEDKRLGAISTKADMSYVDERVAALVNSAPETLDTLGELATAFNENKEVVDALDAAITTKKNADIIVTYAEGSNTTVTHDSRDLYDEIMAGTTVYFKKGTELLSVMEADPSYITFFMFYLNMNNKPQQKVVVITGDSIMIDQDDIYNYVTDTDLNESLEDYYNKLETDTLISDALANITIPEEYDEIILKSSTEGSSKKFKLTIDDDGILTAEEVIE